MPLCVIGVCQEKHGVLFCFAGVADELGFKVSGARKIPRKWNHVIHFMAHNCLISTRCGF